MNNKELIKIILKNKNMSFQDLENLEKDLYCSFLKKNLSLKFLGMNLSLRFETLTEVDNAITPEIFSQIEEIKLSFSDKRHSSGSYYTNKFLINNIINEKEIFNKKIIDPSAGSGNFLINILLKLSDKFKSKYDLLNYFKNYIFYNDLKEESINVFKKRLILISVDKFNQVLNEDDILLLKDNIYNKDFLLDNFNEKFDIILGNPPYLGTKSLGKEYNKKIKETYGFTDDLYALFIYKSINLLKENGFLSFVTSSTYFTISTKSNLRNLLINNGLYKIIINDDKNFDILTKTATFFLEYKNGINDVLLFKESKKEINYFNKLTKKELALNNKITFSEKNEVHFLFEESRKVYEKYKNELSTAKKLDIFKNTEKYKEIIKTSKVVPLGLIAYVVTGIDFKGNNNSSLYNLEKNGKYNIIENENDIAYILSKEDFINGLKEKKYIKAIKGSENLFIKWNKEHFNFLKNIKAPLRNLSLYGDSDILCYQTSNYKFNIVDKNTICINTAGSGFIKLLNSKLISLDEIKIQIDNKEFKKYIKENINNSLCLTTNDLKYIPIIIN